MMRASGSVRSAEAFGRTQLSYSFFMRDFRYSESASIRGVPNLAADPDTAIAGRALCTLNRPWFAVRRSV